MTSSECRRQAKSGLSLNYLTFLVSQVLIRDLFANYLPAADLIQTNWAFNEQKKTFLQHFFLQIHAKLIDELGSNSFGSSVFGKSCCTSVFPVKSIKTEDPRQTGTESRSTGRDTVSSVPPESRRWVPPTIIKEYGLIEETQKDAVFRKVRGILNKLTPENFEKLSDELLKLDFNSSKILNGTILLIFEKAIDEPKYSSMYAQLCKRLSIEAPNFETNNDSCCTFLRLLVNNCRDKFENRAIHFENIINSSSVLTDDDEEKRNIAKAKMLGNVKFIGEIFKLGMLGETHLHKMLRSLLQKGSRQNPTLEERCDDLECLAQILKTCGKQLDASQGKNLMDQYFEHVERKIQTNSYYPARIRFLLRDVIELRNNNWIPRKIARTDGPVPMQDLNTDEDILRGGSAAYLHRQQRDQRNNERDSNHWMSKLPLNLQSTGFNDMFSSLSVAGGTSSLIPPFSPQQNSYNSRGNDLRDNSRHGGGHDSHRGGHRTYNNNNPRNHHHRGGNSGEDGGNNGHNNNYNPRYNKHNNHRDGHQNQNNSHNNSYGGGHHQNNQQQNNMLNNKDIAPRFKRTMMTPTTQTNTVDNLEMRPNQNSLLYKASQQSMKQQQQPLPLQPPSSNNSQNNSPYGGRNSNPEQSRGGHQNTNGHYNNQQQSPYGQNRNSNWNSNYNNHQNNGGNHKNPHGGQHSTHENNFQSSPFGNSGPTLGPNTLLGQTKNAVGKPMAVVAPTASTPINNILQKDTIPIKQAPEKASKKEKKDKGPGKEEFMKLVVAFVNDTLLKQEEESTESKLIEENGEIEENGVTEKKDVDEKEVVNNEDDDQELKKPKKSPGGNTIDDKCAAFLELKVPDKFMKDACIRILNEILDKDDATHDRVIEFLLAMRKPEHKLTNSALLEAFKNVINTMNEKEKTIPKITTIIASLLSRAVLVKLCKLSDIANYAENGQHYPLFLLVLQQLHKKLGKQPLQELFNASKVNLMSSLPEVDRTKDRMAEILEDRNLSFLYPLLRVQSDLWRQITTDPNPQAFYKYIKENIESCLYADPGFITAMTTVIVKFITKESSLADGVDLTKLPDKAIVDKEKQLLEKYGPVLISFLHQKIDLQLIAIYALQVFCYSVNFPKGMLLRWFTALYELNIIDEDAFFQWKEDITDMYPGKGQALFQVNAYLTYLAEAESEEDEEDEA